MKDVCVASGVRDSVDEEWGRGWMPRVCAAGVCVRKAKGAEVSCVPLVFAGLVDALDSRFAGLGWRSAFKRAICASLRFFSAARAALSFCVSMSLRRRV